MFAHRRRPLDRLVSADRFLDRLRPQFRALGITRLGRLTGLDRIGIPVWMATRPNAANLSVSQGKGIDDAGAAISAAMEAAEMALAERPHPAAFVASRASLYAQGGRTVDGARYRRRDCPAPSDTQELLWVEGHDIIAEVPVSVPEEIVSLRDLPGLAYGQSSDGLGAGSCLLEAAVHGLCELVERDASAIWSFRGPAEVRAREVELTSLDSKQVSHLASLILSADLQLRLFDMTTDLGIPAFMATISPPPERHARIRYLDLASGTGAHPFAARAAQRAILEAAQTRLTTIAGARDDIGPAEYERPLPPDLTLFTCAAGGAPYIGRAKGTFSEPESPPLVLDWMIERLREARIKSAVLISLKSEDLGFSIGRVVAPDLEQDPGTKNRRPGRRSIAAMMGRR